MIDPGAIGTLIIGLGEERRQPERGYHPDGPARNRPSRRAIRPAVAIALRHLADALEPGGPGRAGSLDPDRAVSGTSAGRGSL